MQMQTVRAIPQPTRDPAELVETLTSIFERVLQRAPIRPDDDFFDLGGDSIMAVALSLEIEESTGIRLPTTALFDAPTVAALAAQLDGEADPIPSQIAVLNPGADGATGPAHPVFIVPGMSGSAIELRPMAKLVDTAGPIYGLRAPGLDEREAPLDSIASLADHYLQLIRAVQPHGPYFLVGYSIGGLTALEIARRLHSSGEAVALTAMLDTFIHPRHLPLRLKLRIWLRRAGHHLGLLGSKRPREALSYVAGRLPGMLADLGAGAKARAARQQANSGAVPQATRRVMEAGRRAIAGYRLQRFPGAITFIQAADNTDIPAHPDIVWGWVTQRLTVHKVDGDHLNMLGRHAGGMAATFSRCIRDAAAAR